ncbi:hypothetical protein Ndes2526B_g03268 [Nannochloris sp. 'desiccata']
MSFKCTALLYQQQRPSTNKSPRSLVARCQSNTPNSPVVPNRRALLSTGLLAGAALLLSSPQPALAFGSGFPGYDMNLEGRKRAQERIKREKQADLDRAAAYRAKLAEQKAIAAAKEGASK